MADRDQTNHRDTDRRVSALEQKLRALCNQHDSLAELVRLLEAMPIVRKTEVADPWMQQTLKQLNTDIGECGKHYQNVEQTFLQSQNSNINTSVDRNFKNVNSGIVQLRQAIKVAHKPMQECEVVLSGNIKPKTEELKAQQASILKTVASKLDRNKKDIIKSLQEVRGDLKSRLAQSGTAAERLKSCVNETEREFMGKIGRLHEHIGSLRCQMEFIKDKRRKKLIQEQLRARQMPRQLNPEAQQFVLGLIEQQVFLQELMEFHQRHSVKLQQELVSIQRKFAQLKEFLERHPHLEPREEQHIRLQQCYLEDEWHTTQTEIWGIKKKYLIEMRKLQDKLSELQLTKKTVGWKGTQLAILSDKLEQLNSSINIHIRHINDTQSVIAALSAGLPPIV